MNKLIFNNISSEDLGLVIQTTPRYELPEKDYEVINVPGRTGDIIIDKQAYKNIKRSYSLACIFKKNTNFIMNAGAIVRWLASASGYCRLEDTYEPEYYRLAMYRDSKDLPNYLDKATTLDIDFECKAPRYLKSGENLITISNTNDIIITNPTDFVSEPLIEFNGESLTIIISHQDSNGTIISDTITIDSSCNSGIIDIMNQECYNIGKTEYINSKITFSNGLPKLYPGINHIQVSSGTNNLNNVKIKPNWWTL